MKQLPRSWRPYGMYRRGVRRSDRSVRTRTSQVRTSQVRTSQVRTSLASISQKRTGIFVKTEEGGQRAKARSAVLRRTML